MAHLRFRAEIEIIGVNPYVTVSAAQASKLQADWRKPMPVLVQVNGKPDEPWHINMMPKGDGSFYLYLHGDVRKDSETKVGDNVTVDVDFDRDYQNGPRHELPPDMSALLEKNQLAKTNWEALPPSRQKEVLRYLANLKSDEAMQRNLQRLEQALTKDTHFMGRDWKGGR